MVQANVEKEKATKKDISIDGMERPVELEALTEEQVKKERRKKQAAYKVSVSAGQQVGKVMKKAEKKKTHCKRTDSRDDLQEMSTSSSDEKSDDDKEYGDLSDSMELMRNHAPKSIHTGPALQQRASRSTVKFNPSRGGADTLKRNEILAGLRVKIGFKTLVLGDIEGYVSWKREDYLKAGRNRNSKNYQDGSRHPTRPLFVGWSLHNSPDFLDKFHSLLLENDGAPISPEGAFAILKSNMDANGNMLLGQTVIIFFDGDKNVISDKWMRVEIMKEFEEEVHKEDKEGQKNKKKNRHYKSDHSSDGSFLPPEDSSASGSKEDSIYSNNGSVVQCDSRSDVSEKSQDLEGVEEDQDGETEDAEGVEEEDKDGEIGEGEMLGFQQVAIPSDSEEMSDDESGAEELDSGDSEYDGKSD